MPSATSIVMLGATGAVGNIAARTLAQWPDLARLTLLGRRPADNVLGPAVAQQAIDIFTPASYQAYLPGHDVALCTLGVGQPSQMSKEEFVRIDRDVVLDFARGCKSAGVRHFELLSAVGANAASRSLYLRTKGELQEGLKALDFERLSLFQPSMIMTPTNRYGFTQALSLFAMPLLDPLLVGGARKYRSIRVEQLGAAIANNVRTTGSGLEVLQFDQIVARAI